MLVPAQPGNRIIETLDRQRGHAANLHEPTLEARIWTIRVCGGVPDLGGRLAKQVKLTTVSNHRDKAIGRPLGCRKVQLIDGARIV